MFSKHRHLEQEEVVAAAVGVAFDTGLHAVSPASVAARLAVPERAVAAMWPDAEALVAVTFSRIVAAELAEVKRVVLGNPTPVKQLLVLLETLAEPVRLDVDAVWLESWSLGRRNAALGAAVRSEEAAWHTFVAAVVRRGVKSGDFVEVDPDEVAAHLLAIDRRRQRLLARRLPQRPRPPEAAPRHRADPSRPRPVRAAARPARGRVRAAQRRLIPPGQAGRVLSRFFDLLAGLQAR